MCELTGGNVLSTCEEAGGVVEWYASSIANISSYTETAGEITAITMVATKKFYAIKIDPTTSTYTDTGAGDFASGLGRNQSATIVTKGYTIADYTFQTELQSSRIALIAKKSNGTYVILFRDYGGKALVTLDAGTGFETFNGATITVTGVETKQAMVVDSAIIAALIA
jgi:hypothetical protein